MNSDMVKPEKFGHFDLVYQFTVPLRLSILGNQETSETSNILWMIVVPPLLTPSG